MRLLNETITRILPANEEARKRARNRLERLTMPHWAMGRLMDLAVDIAGMTAPASPSLERRTVAVFAADHGVARRGVSLYPSEVTAQMVFNFLRGGAAVNALASLARARVVVVDMGVAGDLSSLAENSSLLSRCIGPGTRDLFEGPAMSREEAVASLEAGIGIALELASNHDLLATGDMGIGNTTASAAIAVALGAGEPAELAGRGTGIDDTTLLRKIEVIRSSIELNRPNPRDPIDILAKVGGFEIGGIAGFILGCAAEGRPVLVDGFISTAGALLAQALAPLSAQRMIAAHLSEEQGHGAMLRLLGKKPLLDLSMRLGEGTGSALAMHLCDAAVALLTRVATFDEAAVSGPAG